MNLKTLFTAASLLAMSTLAFTSNAEAQDKATPASVSVSLININSADASTLSNLPGIGEKKAQAIVAYRELNGNFKSVSELSNVKGIGAKMVERLAKQVTI